MPYVDYFIGNKDEVEAYGEASGVGKDATAEAVAKYMANLPKENSQRKRVAIVTCGKDPTLVAVQGDDEVKRFPVRAIAQETICDTTGAGDAFAGGFSAGIIEGKSLAECIDMGQWLASLTLLGVGAA